jgi:hypothetical protein
MMTDPNIGQRVSFAGREWVIVGVNYLGDYDIECFEERPGGRYKIGSTCVLDLPPDHPHYAAITRARA